MIAFIIILMAMIGVLLCITWAALYYVDCKEREED